MRSLFLLLIFCSSLFFPMVVAQSLEQPWCGPQTFYFQQNASTSPPGYEELLNRPSGNPEADENVTINAASGWVLIDSYITPEEALYESVADLAGLRRYRYYAWVNTASGTTQLNFTAMLRTPDGSESRFYSVESDDINALAVDEYLTSYVSQNDLRFYNTTDRIVIRVYAKTTQPSYVTLHWVYQGSTHTSHVETGYFVCDAVAHQAAAAASPRPLPSAPILGVLAAGMVGIAWRLSKRERKRR